jgi:enoyl-CoA hydratase
VSHVRVEKPRPRTSVIVMDRPERMNSMAFELVVPLHEALEEVAADNDTGVVILTGAGRGFCSGADQKDSTPPPNIAGLTLTRIATRGMSDVTSGFARPLRSNGPKPPPSRHHTIRIAALSCPWRAIMWRRSELR